MQHAVTTSTDHIASHGLARSAILCLAQSSKPERPTEEERAGERGRSQFELEFGRCSNVSPGCLHGLIKSSRWHRVATWKASDAAATASPPANASPLTPD
ncbi:hypothetical protein EYF80_037527 [Liparis tanakae]|uniref:Uncharacterized protein n=1 Tax=Liparis tanakae TaxID=230148 RepID=A0A4Z2GG85_9TELE|nr:hypothetical protein EYF80_037527 [Liparis tanakae]